MFKIKCPACQTEGSLFLVDSIYNGPYRCWQCHAHFTVQIKDNALASYKPLSEEELKKQQDLKKLQDKYKTQD